ncbi:hypothetical protein BpHYR1_042530 [Brachionus plicatilis]|uniref:Uncharacterized protein n=1 Tax=Brachionus plicatilis TaxID=10195 RepID=A0A3M7PPT3_BRAPC|nr:hypothetical protein BpHYR1_042530 [Brachionus plicatilis]
MILKVDDSKNSVLHHSKLISSFRIVNFRTLKINNFVILTPSQSTNQINLMIKIKNKLEYNS